MRKTGINYKTKQKNIILDFLKSLNGKPMSIQEICENLEKMSMSVGFTTVYRNLERLVKEGKMKKYNIDNGRISYYQYVDEGEIDKNLFFYLKCEICNKLINFKCTKLENIQNHLLKEHNFDINSVKTVFYGKCNECKKGV